MPYLCMKQFYYFVTIVSFWEYLSLEETVKNRQNNFNYHKKSELQQWHKVSKDTHQANQVCNFKILCHENVLFNNHRTLLHSLLIFSNNLRYHLLQGME